MFLRCVRLKTPALSRGLRGRLPEVALTLEQRLAALNVTDVETEARVNIGFSFESNKKNAKIMNKARRTEWKLFKKNTSFAKSQLTITNDQQQQHKKIDLSTVRAFWQEREFRSQISLSADHYNIFRDLFEFGYFNPVMPLNASFVLSNDECSPVHYGNIIPCADSENAPEIHYNAEAGQLFTIVMTALDSHLQFNDSEYLHWMVGNIPENNVSKGTILCDYLRPFMPKGTGYHRFAFVLYRQERIIDFSRHKRPSNTTCLRDRTFRTIDFYRDLEDDITPCGLAFFQSAWDDCLVDFFHNNLNMKVPVFEHVALQPTPETFKKFPENEGFNTYIDKFRDPKEIAEDIYCRRLKKLEPFSEEPAPPKFPHAQPLSTELPSWLRAEMTMERDFAGKFQHMKRFSLHPEGSKKRYKPATNLGIKRVL